MLEVESGTVLSGPTSNSTRQNPINMAKPLSLSLKRTCFDPPQGYHRKLHDDESRVIDQYKELPSKEVVTQF